MTLPVPYYQDSAVTLYHGDCREILPLLPKVDLVLTDPPYGVGYKYASHKDDPEEYAALISSVWPLVMDAGKTVISAVPIKNMMLFPQPKWCLAWNKPGSTSRNGTGGFNVWEPIFVWGKTSRFNLDSLTLPDCVNHSKDAAARHPCPKPIKLYQWLILNSLLNGFEHTIIDPFAGSGTTLVAAKACSVKHAIGIEIEEQYCAIAVKRLRQEILL